MITKIGNAIVALAMGFIPGFAQSPQYIPHEGRGATTDDVLRYYHVGLDSPSLIEALKNPNAEVRSVAATKLADNNDKEAISALASALATEKVPQSRLNIAYALGKLGDDRGVVALNNICQDSSEQQFIRSDAARLVLYVAKESPACLTATIDLVEHGNISTSMMP